MIRCGWCGAWTDDATRCRACGHRDPRVPWEQRGEDVPREETTGAGGRPVLDEREVRRLYGEAVRSLEERGVPVTAEAIAVEVDRSARTVREWRKRFGLR